MPVLYSCGILSKLHINFFEGKGQKAAYSEGNIDLSNKAEVEEADRKRFEFVNNIVADVENRKVLTKDKNIGDTIDNIITHPVIKFLI